MKFFEKAEPIEVNGQVIHFRLPQQLAWGAVFGFAFAAVMAGIYYLGVEMHYRVFIDFWMIHLNWAGGSLKHSWDSGMGFIKSKSWHLYRHDIRDRGEPELATLGVLTVLAKPKYWGVKVATWRLFATPFILAIAALALIVGSTWLTYFGLPHLFPSLLTVPHYALITTLVFGVLSGFLLHPIWAPVGARLNGTLIEGNAYRWQHANPAKPIPKWVTTDDAPPVVRERWWQLHDDTNLKNPGKANKRSARLAVTILVILGIVGVIAHFVIGKGIYVPYLSN